MASTECEPITGVWGLCPQRGPGAEPLVRGSGGAPLKLNTFLCCHMPEMAQSCYVYELFMVINGRPMVIPSVTRGAFSVVKAVTPSPARDSLFDLPPTHVLRGMCLSLTRICCGVN